MGTITVTVKDEVEKKFRKVAASVYGKHKGYLGEAITTALEEWLHKEMSVATTLHLLDKGFAMKGLTTKKRSDWHDRQHTH